MVAANSPENIDDYVYLRNEVKLITPIYDTESSNFSGLTAKLVYITLRGDEDESFLVMVITRRSQACCIRFVKKRYQML